MDLTLLSLSIKVFEFQFQFSVSLCLSLSLSVSLCLSLSLSLSLFCVTLAISFVSKNRLEALAVQTEWRRMVWRVNGPGKIQFLFTLEPGSTAVLKEPSSQRHEIFVCRLKPPYQLFTLPTLRQNEVLKECQHGRGLQERCKTESSY